MSTRGLEPSNIVEGARKRLRGETVTSEEVANASPARMGSIERRIASLSVQQVHQYGTQLLNALLEAVDPTDGSPLHENFLELPDAQEYPDYYEIIKRPMALDEIQSKLEQRAYTSLPDVKHDCETICNNAKRYNVRDSLIWVQAKELHSLIKITYVQIIESLPEPGSTPIAQQTPSSDAAASTQPRKRILLKKSHSRLNDQPLPAAATVPQPPSTPPQAVPAAAATATAVAIPPPDTTPLPSRQVLPPPQQLMTPSTPVWMPSQPAYSHSAAASSQYGTPGADDDDLDAEADDDDDRYDSTRTKLTKGGLLDGRKRPGKRGKRLKATLRQLFQNMRRMVGSRGYPLGQHFDVLPSRREHPDYYQIIQKPISLRDIERRVYDKSYINAYALFMDLEQMLNNAQTYYDQNTDIWRDAQEIHSHFEREAIPALIQDGFTLEKDDVRQSALPLHLAANSTIEAHKIAFKMIVAKTGGVEGDNSVGSASPEPSTASNKLRYGSAGLPASPSVSGVDGMPLNVPMSMAPPMGSPSAHMGLSAHSTSPMPYMSATSPTPGVPVVFQDRTSSRHVPNQHFVPPVIPPLPERRVGPGRPRKAEVAARQAHYAAQAAAAAAAAAAQHPHQDQYAGMMQPSGPPPQWQQAQYLQQQQQQRQLQQQQHYQQPPPHHLAQQHMQPPVNDVVMAPPSPIKKKDYLLPVEPSPPLPFDDANERTPLISHFSIDVQLEAFDGHTSPTRPVVLRNSTAKHHSLQVPSTATSVVVEFPLRVLRQAVDATVNVGVEGENGVEENKTEEMRSSKRRYVHPWWPHLLFNGKQVSGSWTSAVDDDEIDPDLLDETSNVGISHCRVRLHPRRGPNVLDIAIKPDANCPPPLDQFPPERYSLFLC